MSGEREVRIEAGTSGLQVLATGPTVSTYHLMAGSLGSCSAMTLRGWAEGAGVDAGDPTLTIRWATADEGPARVARYEIEIHWPTLPVDRAASAERAADGCPIHAALARAVEISRSVRTESDTAAAR